LEEKKCLFCEMIASGNPANLIIENKYAYAIFEGYYREGHCTVVPKRHIEALSQMKPEEYGPTMELIARVSKALEQYYNVKKTYMLAIADMVYHTHFHLIPKHPNLVGMGKYAFRVLEVIEGYKNTPKDEQERMAAVIRNRIGAIT
jgi:diadenosine tetraphosphate (Ap4A) HIT family hydrolase